jgi:spermidine/putrescine-binding protein
VISSKILRFSNVSRINSSRRRPNRQFDADLAHEFLNFMLRPDVSAEIAQTIRTATPNEKAFALLPESTQQSKTLYPDSTTLARAEWPLTLPPDIVRLRDRLWTEAKAA